MRNNSLIPPLILIGASVILITLGFAHLLVELVDFLGIHLPAESYPWIVLIVIITGLFSVLYLIDSIPIIILRFCRWLGRGYRWLDSDWRPPVVRLTDVAIAGCIINGLFVILARKWQEWERATDGSKAIFINDTSHRVINASLSNASSSFNTSYLLSNIEDAPINFFNLILSTAFSTIWYHWEKIFVLWIFLEMVRFSWDASHRLMIEGVVDYATNPKQDSDLSKSDSNSGEDTSKSMADGLADLLIVNLNRISELYRVVDEERAISTAYGAGKPLDANIKTEVSEFLESAVSDTSEFGLGPVKIPMRTITSLIGRLMKGPRIIVSLHKKRGEDQRDRFFLTATMVGNNDPYSWRVDSPIPLEEESDEGRSIEDMITELAHRIFASLTYKETEKLVQWRASYYFSRGLRAYRDALVTTKNRHYNLKMAENRFTETLEEANDFALAYYNLGVVYTELEQNEAADVAFLRAIENNPKRIEAYYAQGMNLFSKAEICMNNVCKIYGQDFWEQEEDICLKEMIHKTGVEPPNLEPPRTGTETLIQQYEDVVRLCDHVIDLIEKKCPFWRRDYAKLAEAQNLKANAQRRMSQLKLNGEYYLHKSIDNAINSAEIAVECSWKALFKAELLDKNVKRTTKIASECLIDLADLYIFGHNYPEKTRYDNSLTFLSSAVKNTNHALFLDPADPNIHFTLGRAYQLQKYFSDSIKEYEVSVNIMPKNSLFWSHLALAYACGGKNGEAIRACGRVSIYGPEASCEALETAAKVYLKLNEKLKPNLEKTAIRLKRAALRLELKEYLGMQEPGEKWTRQELRDSGLDMAQNIFYIKSRLKREREKRGDDWEWRYAQFALALKRLCDMVSEEDRPECRDEKANQSIDENLEKAIRNLGTKVGSINHVEVCAEKLPQLPIITPTKENSGCKLEGCQDLFTLLRLYIEYYKLIELKLKHDEKTCLDSICNKYYFIIKDAITEEFESYKKCRDLQVYGDIDEEVELQRHTRQQKEKEGKCPLSVYKNELGYEIIRKKRYEVYLLEYSQILMEVGLLYLNYGKSKKTPCPPETTESCLKKAEECFRDAILMLEIDFPEEIKRKELNAHLAESLRLQGKEYKALKKAREAQILNSLNREESYVTGKIYCDLKMHNKALDELYNALSWEPDDPDLLVEIGLCYMNRAKDYLETNETRVRSLKKALKVIEQAWELYNKDDLKERSEARYYIAKIYMELGEYVEAIPHFTVIYNAIESRKNSKEHPEILILGLQLGFAYLKKKSYRECEKIFREIIENNGMVQEIYFNDIFIRVYGNKFNEALEYGLDLVSPGKVMACAHIGLASSYIGRDIGFNLEKSLNEVRKAESYVDRLSEYEKTECQAFNADCKGWILYKQDLFCDKDTIEAAIECLEESISLKPTSRAYLHLSLAYKRKSKKTKDEKEKEMLIERARSYYRHAQDMDIKNEYKTELEELKKWLEIERRRKLRP